jgi:hypothetical protein
MDEWELIAIGKAMYRVRMADELLDLTVEDKAKDREIKLIREALDALVRRLYKLMDMKE